MSTVITNTPVVHSPQDYNQLEYTYKECYDPDTYRGLINQESAHQKNLIPKDNRVYSEHSGHPLLVTPFVEIIG